MHLLNQVFDHGRVRLIDRIIIPAHFSRQLAVERHVGINAAVQHVDRSLGHVDQLVGIVEALDLDEGGQA